MAGEIDNKDVPAQSADDAASNAAAIDGDVREHPAFRGVLKQLSDATKQLDALKRAEAERVEAERVAALKRAGDMQALETDYAGRLAARDAEVLSLRLRLAVQGHGITHPALLAYAATEFAAARGEDEDLNPDVWAVEFAKRDEVAALIAPPPKSGAPPTPGGAAAGRSTSASLEERARDGDVSAQRELWERLGLSR
jgi:hypothetical protein